MKTYRSHKTVQASRIVAVGECIAHTEDGSRYDHTYLSPCYVPVPGDYVVVYKDGYGSISPSVAFEDGYGSISPCYVPVPGDYVVVYKDGYGSISPSVAFEDGYTEVLP